MELSHINIDIEISEFIDFRQNCQGGFSTVKASSNIKLAATIGGKDAFDVMFVNANRKSAMESKSWFCCRLFLDRFCLLFLQIPGYYARLRDETYVTDLFEVFEEGF